VICGQGLTVVAHGLPRSLYGLFWAGFQDAGISNCTTTQSLLPQDGNWLENKLQMAAFRQLTYSR
jgi:hypothetical protein